MGIYIYTHYKGNVIIRMNQHIRVTASYVVSCGIWYNLIQLHMCHMYPYVPWSKIGWYNNDIFILVDGHSSILGWMTLKHTPCFDFFLVPDSIQYVVLSVGPKIWCPHHYLVFSMDIKYHLSFCFHPILGITLIPQFDQRYGNLPGKIHHLMAVYCIYDWDVIIGYSWDVTYDTNMWVCLAWLATQTIASPVGKMGWTQGTGSQSISGPSWGWCVQPHIID